MIKRSLYYWSKLYEEQLKEELTDVLEIYFIEIPKLREENDVIDMLVAWMQFLKDPISEKVRNLEMSIEEIEEIK